MIAWKLFEERNGMPISLVHGMPYNGTRSRRFKLDTWLFREDETPGFNCFLGLDNLIRYLPRFKVRAPRLQICAITIPAIEHRPNSVYGLSTSMFISSIEWSKRMKGSDLL